MIGDAVAKGKRSSTAAKGPEFKKKNSMGGSFKHVAPGAKSDGGAAHENKHSARRANKGMAGQRGFGQVDGQKPARQKAAKEVAYLQPGDVRSQASRMQRSLSRSNVEAWTSGKRGSYK
jgi:hypothetical protein